MVVFRGSMSVSWHSCEGIPAMATIPLFPLNLVLFPGASLALRIFETRYIDLVSECLRSDSGFGVCLILTGKEVGGSAQCHKVGTYARIIDWSRLEDGLLGITVEGGVRFRVLHFSERTNRLLQGDVEWLEEPVSKPIETKAEPALRDLLVRILEHYEISYDDQDRKLLDPVWLGYRLAEYLPLDLHARQTLLEMNNGQERLEALQQLLSDNNFAGSFEA